MAGETVITIIGNLTADPELRTLSNGNPVASFTIASTPRTYNRQTQQYEDGTALFLRCSAWNDLARHISQSCSKGMRVIAQGRLSQRSYQAQDGTNRTVVEMTVDEIGPSLRYATAQVTRAASGGGGGGQSRPAQQQQVSEEPWSTPGSSTSADAWSTPGSFGDDTPF